MRPDTRKLTAIKLAAGHTASGNPRRVYVLLDRFGAIVATVDEGYEGWHAVKRAGFPNAVFGPTFSTTGPEYRELTRNDRPHTADDAREQRARWGDIDRSAARAAIES